MKFPSALLAGLLLGGGARVLAADQAPQKTSLDCDQADMWSVGQETHGICTGSVTLIGTNLKISCDRLEFTALGIGDKGSTLPTLEKFKSLLATGHVVIVQGDREATCGRAEVLPHEDKVVLTENPIVIDHGSDLTNTGEEITLDHRERRVIVKKAHVVGPPIKDLGFEQPKPAEPPAESAPKPGPAK
jgi:lipopolysaccharide export system protein LptA